MLSAAADSVCAAAAAVAAQLNIFGAEAACAAAIPQLALTADDAETQIVFPVLLSLLAGLSTSIGGVIAVTLTPDEGTLAFLLGTGKCVAGCLAGCAAFL